VLTSADLVYIWTGISEGIEARTKTTFVTLDDDEQKVYDYLLKTGKELMDIIALRCEFPIYKISGMLLIWNWKVIRPLPGKLFEAI
jgi:DNA processing protein